LKNAMASFRFRFALRPLTEVKPWGESEPYLNWFGLTEGKYWIELDEKDTSLCFSAVVGGSQEECARKELSYVDYYVARYWEDLGRLTQTVMQPVPDLLAEFVASDPEDWAPIDSDEAWEASVWHGAHMLDLSYLREPPHISAWRRVADDLDEVTFTWRHPTYGQPRLIAKPDGCVHMPTTSFANAVLQLNDDLMTAMRKRVVELGRAGPRLGVAVDMDRLWSEQSSRAAWFGRQIDEEPTTNWDAVGEGARQLLTR
jgi:hypothetical protein